MPETVDVALRVNGVECRVAVRTDRRLLDVLREDLRLTGSKEGCGKGECGACTVLLDGRPVDSCLVLATQADGGCVETIEGLADAATLDPVQEAFVEHGAAQCGICIPGMIVAARALLDETPDADETAIRHGLAGNLCRCTGYTKIVAAVAHAARSGRRSRPQARPPAPALASRLRPRSLDEAVRVYAEAGGRLRLLAGGTDVLVQAMDGTVRRDALLDLTALPELRGIEERDGHLWLGAGVSHAELVASPLVARWAPALPEACRVIGGPQIRNRGTLGGNLANASPAADAVPALIVAEAEVELASPRGSRRVPVEGFATAPRRTVLAPDEILIGVRVPRREGIRGAFRRLGQRRAQAISKVSVAVALDRVDGRPGWVRIAFGAVAPTVIRAPEAERALLEGGLGEAAVTAAAAAARREVRPIDDLRSTREYRREMAGVLLARAVAAIAG